MHPSDFFSRMREINRARAVFRPLRHSGFPEINRDRLRPPTEPERPSAPAPPGAALPRQSSVFAILTSSMKIFAVTNASSNAR